MQFFHIAILCAVSYGRKKLTNQISHFVSDSLWLYQLLQKQMSKKQRETHLEQDGDCGLFLNERAGNDILRWMENAAPITMSPFLESWGYSGIPSIWQGVCPFAPRT